MNRFFLPAAMILFLLSCKNKEALLKQEELLKQVSTQLQVLNKNTPFDSIPRSFCESTGYKMVSFHDWTCGFPSGSYWLMFELTNDETWKKAAIENTLKLDGVQDITSTHDLGFMVYCSFGNGFRLIGDSSYSNRIITASENLVNRFNPKVGCIRSWDFGTWQFPVIIDNMMNLEMLFRASDLTGNPVFRDVAVIHANTTLKNHFRGDFSSYHVVDYDTITGQNLGKYTHQGLNDSSAWGRGQAWGLYGFTVCYRETHDSTYLKIADNIAGYILKSLPDDKISIWDYNDPKIPETYRDASAAAITASALYELSQYSERRTEYRIVADAILNELASEKYRSTDGSNGGFILKHSVGSLPANSEVDVAINYADYYFVEAIKRKYQK